MTLPPHDDPTDGLLFVCCVGSLRVEAWKDQKLYYSILEDEDGGLFYDLWGAHNIRIRSIKPVWEFRSSRWGHLDHKEVTPEEAMAMTGLDHPMAAMDKVREAVHEARSCRRSSSLE